VIGKCVDQRLGFSSLYSLDPGAIVAHDIEAFMAGYGMGPDDGTGDRRVAIYFPLEWAERPACAQPSQTPRGARQDAPRTRSGKASHAAGDGRPLAFLWQRN
jgi:hypothetical protein